jgi:hypothetical protein
MAPASASATMLEYQLLAVSGSDPDTQITDKASYGGLGGKTVTVPPGSGTINMILYAAIMSTNGIATDDGYNGGYLCFLSASNGANPKIHGALSGVLVNTGGVHADGSPGVGFANSPSSNGSPFDLNGDGDMDWGDTASGSTKRMFANAGSGPFYGDMVWGEDPLVNINGVDRTMIPAATVDFDYVSVGADAAIIHGYGFSNVSPATCFRTDGVLKNLKNNSTDISPRGTTLNPTFDITVTSVPEPAALALLAAGAAILLPWRRRG